MSGIDDSQNTDETAAGVVIYPILRNHRTAESPNLYVNDRYPSLNKINFLSSLRKSPYFCGEIGEKISFPARFYVLSKKNNGNKQEDISCFFLQFKLDFRHECFTRAVFNRAVFHRRAAKQ
jgi:hypothetical protein